MQWDVWASKTAKTLSCFTLKQQRKAGIAKLRASHLLATNAKFCLLSTEEQSKQLAPPEAKIRRF